MRSALIKELSWGSVAYATDGDFDAAHRLVASSRNCHGDAGSGHKKTPPTEVDGVKRLKVGGTDAHAEHRQQQYG